MKQKVSQEPTEKKASAFYDIGVDLWDIMISDKTGLSMSDIGFNVQLNTLNEFYPLKCG